MTNSRITKTLVTPAGYFLRTPNSNRIMLAINVLLALLYFFLLAFWFPRGHPVLFGLLIAGEVFHVWQILGYLYTIWDFRYQPAPDNPEFSPFVDVFITVAGEPVDIVEQTVKAALEMDYPNARVYILNDGYVAGKPNWREMETLAKKLGATCITRTVKGGAKAGNINYALSQTDSPLVAVFDADQVPHKNFLRKTVGYFANPAMGFVQSPQYYKNYELNEITGGSWEQQELFFGPICKGKNRLNSTFMCGTNMVIRRTAIMEAGGMCETNIAEDFLTSLLVHQRGWKSVYVPEVLAEGLAPEDFLSYYKQQLRWARGSLEVIFRYNPLFNRSLTWAQKTQYLSSASYYLSGPVVLMNALLPIVFFFTGQTPVNISTMSLAAAFLPYILISIIVLRLSSNYSYTFRALSFSMSSFPIHLQALWAILTNQKTGFSVTAKKQLSGSFLHLASPHILYFILILSGVSVSIIREGLSAAVITNLSWALFNAAVFFPFIMAAGLSRRPDDENAEISYVPSPGWQEYEDQDLARQSQPMFSVRKSGPEADNTVRKKTYYNIDPIVSHSRGVRSREKGYWNNLN